MQQIEWKQIAEFLDYSVSSDGRIRFEGGYRAFGNRKRYAPPCERTPQPHSGGYLQVRLQKEGAGLNRYVHRLIALAFLPRKEGCDFVNHINGDKTDNRVENLEWVTVSENHLHKTRVLHKGTMESHGRSKLTREKVAQIRAIKGTQQSIADAFGVSRAHVGMLRSDKRRLWAD